MWRESRSQTEVTEVVSQMGTQLSPSSKHLMEVVWVSSQQPMLSECLLLSGVAAVGLSPYPGGLHHPRKGWVF